jgi:hypothetical protein
MSGMKSPDPFQVGRPYRVVVTAVGGRDKGFVWAIVRRGKPDSAVQTSTKSYQSMEAAYDDGAIALRRFN